MRLRKKPWIPQALEEYWGKELLEDGLEQYRGQWSQQVLGAVRSSWKSAAARGSSWQP